MNFKEIGRFMAQILFVEVIFMIPALFISLYCGETAAINGFVYTMLITLVVAGIIYFICRKAKGGSIHEREGYVCVGLSWIVLGLFGCLPFYISGEIPHFVDALFEIVSGFTTTGASILPEVESLSKGILYWRSFSHWLGGMGVLVFLLAIAPANGSSNRFTMHLLRAESPGPEVGKLVSRMKSTASILYVIYMILTLLDMIFLLLGGIPVFDAVCTAFGTAGTGGFGIKNDSIAGYSPYIQNVCTVFMILFGINFNCYYLIVIKHFKSVLKDEEIRMYLGIIIASVALITYNVRDYYDTIGETIRHAAFQVASIMTTTGFATTDFDLWPSFSKTLLLCLMIVGASAGSTGGGMKCGRVLLVLKSLRKNLYQIFHPQIIRNVRVNNRSIEDKTLHSVNTYFAAYFVLIIISFLAISVDGFSTATNFSAVLACFNNIGPGLEKVGPTCNYGDFSIFSKMILVIDMLAGRLEIFPIMVLFMKSTWKR